MRVDRCGDQVDSVLFELVIEAVAVIRPITNEMFRLGLQDIEVETQLHQGDFMMIRRVRVDGEGQSVPIHNRQDFHAFAAFREPHGLAAAFGRRKRRIDETLPFIDCAFVTQRIGQVGQDLPQHLALTPLLESAMDGFVVRIALREQVRLGAGVQNPEHRLQNRSGRHGFAAGSAVRDVLFREVLLQLLLLVVAGAA